MQFVALYATEGEKGLISRRVKATDRIGAIKEAHGPLRRELKQEIKADPLFYALKRNDRGRAEDRVAKIEAVPVRPTSRKGRSH